MVLLLSKSAAYLVSRDPASITQTTVFATLPDAICVLGPTAGSPTDTSALKTVKAAAGSVPVFVSPGARSDNVVARLGIADGAVVGTFFKKTVSSKTALIYLVCAVSCLRSEMFDPAPNECAPSGSLSVHGGIRPRHCGQQSPRIRVLRLCHDV